MTLLHRPAREVYRVYGEDQLDDPSAWLDREPAAEDGSAEVAGAQRQDPARGAATPGAAAALAAGRRRRRALAATGAGGLLGAALGLILTTTFGHHEAPVPAALGRDRAAMSHTTPTGGRAAPVELHVPRPIFVDGNAAPTTHLHRRAAAALAGRGPIPGLDHARHAGVEPLSVPEPALAATAAEPALAAAEPAGAHSRPEAAAEFDFER